jgi:uncharacterized protein (DUF1697 family)
MHEGRCKRRRAAVPSPLVSQRIVLLRGINIGPHKRIAMAELRDLLARAGFEDVRTYLQSGNVVLTSDAVPDTLAGQCEQLIAERFDLRVPVIVRTLEELAEVVRRNPLEGIAVDPKRYQVSFMAAEPADDAVRGLAELTVDPERFAVIGRELYSWHPMGIARSRLWAALAGPGLGVPATARNWTTVTRLLAMAQEG